MTDPLVLARTLLLSLPAVTAIVSTRVYSGLLPQGVALPAIATQLIDRFETTQLRGMAGSRQSRVQVHSVAPTRHAAYQLMLATEGPGDGSALLGYQGVVGGKRIRGIFDGGTERELYRTGEFGAEYEVIRDYLIHFDG